MAKEYFKNLPDTSTPLTAPRLNGLLDGEESMGDLVVDSIRTKNMFGNYTIINGWIYGTGMRVNETNGNRMAFVKCEPNTTYTISRSVLTGTFRVGDYTSIPIMTSSNVDYTLPKAIIEDNNATSITYTTSSTAQYLIVHYGTIEDTTLNESLTTIQVEKGTTATTYSPYQDLENQEIYSTNEVKIGTWVDGKPLYRKVFNFTTTSSAYTFTTYNTGLTNVGISFIDGGYIDNNGVRTPLNIARIHSNQIYNNDYNWFRMTAGNINYEVGNSQASADAYVFVCYTKTTD